MNVQVEALKVVADFTAKFRMFTAYDVTKMVRHSASQLGLNDRVSHYGKSGVQELVHEFFSSGQMSADYARTIAEVDSNSGQTAFVYHDQDDDPNVYDSVWVEREIAGTTAVAAAAVVPIAAVAAAFSAPVDLSDPSDDDVDDDTTDGLSDYVILTDQRGRACVPSQAIKDVGGKAGDLFVAMSRSDELVLTKGVKSIHSQLNHYIVDKSGNIRVSACRLLNAGVRANTVDIVVDPTRKEIVLT